jgi:hypothetical protein
VEGSDNYCPEISEGVGFPGVLSSLSERTHDRRKDQNQMHEVLDDVSGGQRIRPGYQMQCPHCLKLLTFDSSSGDNNIRRALKSANELRALMEEARQDAGDHAVAGSPPLKR